MKNPSQTLDDHLSVVGNEKVSRFLVIVCLYAFALFYVDVDIAWVVLTAYTPPHFCKIEEIGHLPLDIQKNISIPRLQDGNYDSCHSYERNYSIFQNEWDYADSSLLKNTSTIPCDEWNYEFNAIGETIVTEFNWVCEKKLMYEFITTVSFAGMLGGTLTGGYISDWYGRKTCLMYAITLKVVGYMISTFCVNPISYMVGRFIVCYALIIVTSNAIVLIYEFSGKKYRNMFGMIAMAGYEVGTVGGAVMAYYISGWKLFYYIVLSMNIVTMLFSILLFESPRWLYLRNRHKQYESTMKKIAAFNGITLPEDFKFYIALEKRCTPSHVSIKRLFHNKTMSKITLIEFTMWFTESLIFYAISLNTNALFGNLFLNFAMMGVVAFPMRFVGIWMMDNKFLGRKYSHMMHFILGGILTLAIVPCISIGYSGYIVTVLVIATRVIIGNVFGINYTYTSELYPTEIRNIGLLTCSAMARLSGMICPYFGVAMQKTWEPLPYMIFGTLSLIVGCLIYWLPETRGKALLQRIGDGINPENGFINVNDHEEKPLQNGI